MAKTETYLAILQAIECGVCGIPFAFPTDLVEKRKADGKDFYCPNGHCIAYGDTEVQRLRRKVKQQEAETARAKNRAEHWESQATTAEYRRRAARGQLTKLKKRIAAGDCPCCHEHFPDLEKHMADEHPGYAQEVHCEE